MRQYMEQLRARGQLLEVQREVQARHELAAVTQAVQRRHGKPILFHHVSGTKLSVLTNIYGSRERLAEILGIAPADFCRQWNQLAALGPGREGPLKREVGRPADLVETRLSDLPLLTYAERDGAPYFTSAIFLAREPETGVPNLSFHRIDLQVPASTEIVIEGRFLPNVRRPEGPFGEFMGYYVPVGDNAVFEVLGVSMRPDAIFHSILCGGPEEVLTLELSVAANIYQRISAVLPGIIDVTCQPFVLHTVVKIRQQYEGHARQVLMAVFGAEPTWAKTCTVVDEDVNIYDMNDVMWAVLTRSRPDADVLVLPGIPSFYRDPHKDHWGRLGIDATAPFARRHEFERKRIPGADTVDVAAYISGPDAASLT